MAVHQRLYSKEDGREKSLISKQLSFDQYFDLGTPHAPAITTAIEKLSTSIGTESRGAIFTRPEVVDFILDLAGYTTDQPLHQKQILEPSFGRGDFLLPIVSRLLTAWKTTKETGQSIEELSNAIRAVELHSETFHTTRKAVIALLISENITFKIAAALADRWLSQADFLLTPLESQFDFVVGNPPYVRQELIPPSLLIEYRRRYQTIYELRSLQAVLLSAVTRLFITTYSTQMQGGFLWFQAQYLRRIRIPQWIDVPPILREELADAAIKRDLLACNRATFKLYGLNDEEQFILGDSEQ